MTNEKREKKVNVYFYMIAYFNNFIRVNGMYTCMLQFGFGKKAAIAVWLKHVFIVISIYLFKTI